MHHLNTSDAATPVATPPSVKVPLQGKQGAGYFVILDEADWQHVQREYGSAWTRSSNGFGRFYVSSHRVALKPLTGQPVRQNVVARLARLLLGAKRGDAVVYLDSDTLNLRRSNLFLRTGKKAAAWKAERARARSDA